MARILVVDDSPVDLQLFASLLAKMEGASVFQARNGNEALSQIEEWQIELVVTDLQMPDMDGLELVKTIRERFPDIPTILMTGVGSEEIAAQALLAGAAGYVPKSNAAELLVPTVEGVVDIMFREHSFERLLDRAKETRFVFELENDEDCFPALIVLCDQMLQALSPLDRIDRIRVGVAVEQVLSNALYRGNLEIEPVYNVQSRDGGRSSDVARLIDERKKEYASRSIVVTVEISAIEFRLKVRDDGPGCKAQTAPQGISRQGRGLTLMRTFMDHVEFNRSGNEVTLVRSWSSVPVASGGGDDLDELLKTPDSAGAMNLGVFVDCYDGTRTELFKPRLMIGREPSCHIVLNNPEIADHHCQLLFNFGVWYFKSVSDEQIFLNGKPASQGKLTPEDQLGLGGRKFQIEYQLQES